MNKIVKMVLLGVVAVIIVIALITGSNIFFFWSIFDWFQDAIVIAGLNPLLAKAIASLLLAVVVMLPLGKMTLSFTPIPQKNKGLYRALIFICIGIFFSLAALGTRNAFFDSKKGVPLKYYSEVNGKIRIFTAPGFDPETGDSLLPVTKEVILRSKGIQLKKEVEPSGRSEPASFISANGSYSMNNTNSVNNMAATTTLKDSVVKKEIASQIDSVKSDSIRINTSVIKTETPKEETFVEPENTLPPPPRKPRTLAEILSGKVDENVNQEEPKEEVYTGPIGYSISIIDNPNLEYLGNIFKEENHYKHSHRHSSCKTELENFSSGRFEFYDENKSLLFRVPAKKKMVLVLEPGYYYFKTEESFKFTPFNLPDREKFNMKISEVRDVPSGEILIGGVSDF